MTKHKLNKLSIVFEDTGEQDGNNFNVYLEGDTERLSSGLKVDKLSGAEYWAGKSFEMVVSLLHKANVVDSETSKQQKH